mmetsp:Transcript_17492/g.40230  ORF Transcript_17492/g.40230 Transcript_17492/m.40230 type:complete len:200 (+) Transcript_17492:525-1124(+)
MAAGSSRCPMSTSACLRSPKGSSHGALTSASSSSGSEGHSDSGCAAYHVPPKSKCTSAPACDQSPTPSGLEASHTIPFDRKSLGELEEEEAEEAEAESTRGSSTSQRRIGWKGRRASKCRLLMPYSSDSGTCSPRSSRSHPGALSAASKSKRCGALARPPPTSSANPTPKASRSSSPSFFSSSCRCCAPAGALTGGVLW